MRNANAHRYAGFRLIAIVLVLFILAGCYPGLVDPVSKIRAWGKSEDASIYFADLVPDSLYYTAFILIGDGTSQSFTLSASAANAISGTITLPGYTDTAGLPSDNAVILRTEFSGKNISATLLGEPTVNAGNLEWSYILGYDGDEAAVLFAGFINNFASWPAEGDYFGAWDGNTGTQMDFLNQTGIDPYHFTGDVTGIDFILQLIEGDTATDLENTRVDVTVNFSYTGSSGPTDSYGAVMLTYSDGGPAFAGTSFYYNDFASSFVGSVSFDNHLVPVGTEVYAQIYFDADDSLSLSAGDPYYKHPVPISVDGGTVDISFGDAELCGTPCPDMTGGWRVAVAGWGDMVITITEDAFAILWDTTTGSPSYEVVASINNYGVITEVSNGGDGGYMIGQWTHHPAGASYEGKYLKICWEDRDGFRLTDIYYAFGTEAEALAASTGSTELSMNGGIW